MSESEVCDLAVNGIYENTRLRGTVEETHISWVILTKKLAFKIKKPVKLSFLDFSTLAMRKHQCERELLLNRRFSDIYLSVEPICQVGDQWVLGEKERGGVREYCVVMRKMNVSRRMDKVLRDGKVHETAIRRLASRIALFHSNAEICFVSFDIDQARNTFNDIGSIVESVSERVGPRFFDIVTRSIEWSDTFLEKHSRRMQERIEQGMRRDVHGDLHSGNIFLYRNPVLFDCIEFNDEFRRIDVLYEIAFLAMDLERFRQVRLANVLVNEYSRHFPVFGTSEDHSIFTYFKCLRANIRAKVHAVQLGQTGDASEVASQVSEIQGYLTLMNRYMTELS